MPLPVLHSYTGYAVYRLAGKEKAADFKLAALCILLANLADFDFIPGILTGHAGRFHHGAAHSFGAALICGLGAAFALKLWKKRGFLKTFFLSSICYASHIILDVMNRPEEKIPIFWPFSSSRLSFGADTLHSLQAAPSPEAAQTGLTQFMSIIWGPETLHRLIEETLCIVTTLAVFLIYSELKKHALLVQKRHVAEQMKHAPAILLPPAGLFKESQRRAAVLYAEKSA